MRECRLVGACPCPSRGISTLMTGSVVEYSSLLPSCNHYVRAPEVNERVGSQQGVNFGALQRVYPHQFEVINA
ncbi:MAG: hypothetical protein QXL64_06395 [Thermofilaceae archaeon]